MALICSRHTPEKRPPQYTNLCDLSLSTRQVSFHVAELEFTSIPHVAELDLASICVRLRDILAVKQ